MASIRNTTIEGLNTFLREQKALDGSCTFTLWLFDDQHEVVYNAVDIKDVPFITSETFVPRGYTALHDAICMAIDSTGKRLSNLAPQDRPNAVLFCILTDGEENRSKEFKAKDVNDKITHQRNKYSWDFTFLGANQDAITTAGSLGISASKTLSFAANKLGSESVFKSVSSYYSTARAAVNADHVDGLYGCAFSEEDWKAQVDAGL